MSRVFTHAIIVRGKIDVEYEATAFGKTVPARTTDLDSALGEELLATIQEQAPKGLKVAEVQIYSAARNPENNGAVIDIKFAVGCLPPAIRLGDSEDVPVAIATARDQFKAAVQKLLTA